VPAHDGGQFGIRPAHELPDGSDRGPLHIHGLDLQVAQQLVHELTTITQATEGDAT